ncbi:hypothetical protein HGRIS_011522 [Hohenbuehelia grisea]|uniref:Uncharacterized protein n=1 Tax=Hohenbuehelia grisea TaxID=104357 RepID=A0ABR3JXL0_9AGAR
MASLSALGDIQVIEIRGGDGRAYYDGNVKPIEGEYAGSQYFDTGLPNIFYNAESLVRLNAACYELDEEDAIDDNDLEGTAQFFQEI